MKFFLIPFLFVLTTLAANRTPTMGTNEVALYREAAPVINMRAQPYFANGGGVVSDTAVISAAITAASAGTNKTVHFPAGTYKTAAQTIPEGVNLSFANGAMLSVDAGQTVTVNGNIQAGLWRIFGGAGTVLLPAVPVIYPQWFGADETGSADSKEAFQDTIDAAISSLSFTGIRRIFNKIVVPTGEYLISDTVQIINAYQLNFEGDSGSSTFVWTGATNVPMFRIINGYQCEFNNFRIRANNTSPLLKAFEQYSDIGFGPDYTHASTGNRYSNVQIEGQSGSALAVGWQIGGLVGGLFGIALGDDQNNDYTRFDDCKVLGASLACWDLEGANCYDNMFFNCIAQGSSATASIGLYSDSANFHWYGGGIFLAETGIKFETQSGSPSTVEGMNMEQSARIYDSGAFSGAQQILTMKNIRFSPDGSVAADGKIIKYHKGGSLTIDNLRAYNVNGTNSLKIEILNNNIFNLNVSIKNSYLQNDDGTIFTDMMPNSIENLCVLRNGTFIWHNNRFSAPSHDFQGTITGTGGAKVLPLIGKSGLGFYTGAAGATTYEYKVTAVSDTGESTAGDTVSIANAAATLTVANYNTIMILGFNRVQGARYYKFYRTAPAAQQALIATISGATYPNVALAIDDGSVVGSGSPTADNVPPTTNTSGNVWISGLLPNEFVKTDATTNLRSAPLALASYIQGTPLEIEVTGAGTLADPTVVGIPSVPRITTRLEVGGAGTSTQIGYFQGDTDGATELRHANINSGSSAVASVMAHNGGGFIALDAFGTGHATAPGWMRLRANTNLLFEATGSATNYLSFRIANGEYFRITTNGATLTGAASISGNITNAALTASRAVGTDANKALVSLTATTAEVDRLSGLTTNLVTTLSEISGQLPISGTNIVMSPSGGRMVVSVATNYEAGSGVEFTRTATGVSISSTNSGFTGGSTFTYANTTAATNIITFSRALDTTKAYFVDWSFMGQRQTGDLLISAWTGKGYIWYTGANWIYDRFDTYVAFLGDATVYFGGLSEFIADNKLDEPEAGAAGTGGTFSGNNWQISYYPGTATSTKWKWFCTISETN